MTRMSKMPNEERIDVVLSAQFMSSFDETGFEYKEQIYSYCINEMILSVSDMLHRFHEYIFKGMPGGDPDVVDPTFETVEDCIKDVVGYLFCILNNMKIDSLPYGDIMAIKNEVPMVVRTDKVLATIALLQVLTDISTLLWTELDGGNMSLIQRDLDKPISENEPEPGIENDVLDAAGTALALVDTICQHLGKSLRDVL